MNPILNETYTFLFALLEELAEVFDDDVLHIGGDEVVHGTAYLNHTTTLIIKPSMLGRQR